jgi:hypothetical protein
MNPLVINILGALLSIAMEIYGYFAIFRTNKLIEYYKRNSSVRNKAMLEQKMFYYRLRFIGIIIMVMGLVSLYAISHAIINGK